MSFKFIKNFFSIDSIEPLTNEYPISQHPTNVESFYGAWKGIGEFCWWPNFYTTSIPNSFNLHSTCLEPLYWTDFHV